ncbi:MAG: hypothetical protein AB7N99_01040 [Simkaniaceae bacterium]|jgi:hypothetical protein
MASIKDFSYRKADFFGPQADQLTDLLGSVPIEHFIAGCDAPKVRAINALAEARVLCQEWPEWQREDGSLIYDKLPESVRKIFKPSYLDAKGYIDIQGLQIFEKYTLVGCARHQKIASHLESPWDRQDVEEMVACPSLAIRLQQGPGFDPREHQEILLEETPTLTLKREGILVPLYRSLSDLIEGRSKDAQANGEIARFQKIWDYAIAQPQLDVPKQEEGSPSYLMPTVIGLSLLGLITLAGRNIHLRFSTIVSKCLPTFK